MSLPRIGITCSSAMGITQAIEKVGRGYIDGVLAAGGLPVVLPSLDPDLAASAVAGLDGLVLTGGGDVDPSRYGAAPQPECGPPDAARDSWGSFCYIRDVRSDLVWSATYQPTRHQAQDYRVILGLEKVEFGQLKAG